MKTMTIFAYGSNMNINRLQKRVPSANKLTIAYLKGYCLVCNKISTDGSAKANIIKSDDKSDVVWGVLFEISESEKINLDRVEGLGKGYNETKLEFFDSKGNEYKAQVYIADEDFIDDTRKPYDWYREYILSGAIQNQLPIEYLNLISAIDFVSDTDFLRRDKHYAVINS